MLSRPVEYKCPKCSRIHVMHKGLGQFFGKWEICTEGMRAVNKRSFLRYLAQKEYISIQEYIESLKKLKEVLPDSAIFVSDSIAEEIMYKSDCENDPWTYSERICDTVHYYESKYLRYEPNNNKEQNIDYELDNKMTNDMEENIMNDLTKTTMNEDNLNNQINNNNFFSNMTAEVGQNKDVNIASTLMGIAVKGNGTWYIYDKKQETIIDVGNQELGKFPLFNIPVFEMEKGDLIKKGDEYFFVRKNNNKENIVELISPISGVVTETISSENILGFSCYTKVVAMTDVMGVESGFEQSDNMMKMMMLSSMMSSQSNQGENNRMNAMLPMMMLGKDSKLGENDDMMKMVMLSSMMSSQSNQGESNGMNAILPMMMLGKDSKLGENDDMIKMVMLSSMMSSQSNQGESNGMNAILPMMMLGKDSKLGENDNMMKMMMLSSMMSSQSNQGENNIMNSMLPYLMMSRTSAEEKAKKTPTRSRQKKKEVQVAVKEENSDTE